MFDTLTISATHKNVRHLNVIRQVIKLSLSYRNYENMSIAKIVKLKLFTKEITIVFINTFV